MDTQESTTLTRCPCEQQHERGLFIRAGIAYGIVFALAFSLLAWGYDAVQLARSDANLAWASLVVGIPVAVTICGVTGGLAAVFSSAPLSVGLWTVMSALLGFVAGHIPFEGRNLVIWITDHRLWGSAVFPFDSSSTARTALTVIVSGAVGAASGLLECLVLEWAWDRSTPEGRMSGMSWAVLLSCLPLAILLTGTTNELVNHPLRAPQESVARLISAGQAGQEGRAEAQGLNTAALQSFRGSLSEEFVTYLVTYELSPPRIAFVDAVFDSGLVLRCRTVGNTVAFCEDMAPKFNLWMDDLIQAGRFGERRGGDSSSSSLLVDDQVVQWLQARQALISPPYQLNRAGQQGRFTFMAASFETGYQITCRFQGAHPTSVDQCIETALP